MKIRELFEDKFLDWVENTPLLEMAWSRKEAESKITQLAKPILVHLIKILKWKDDHNFEKHCRDINVWCQDIEDIILKNGKRPEAKYYYQWMYVDYRFNEPTISKWIKRLSINYGNLKSIRDEIEVLTGLQIILQKLSIDIAANNFEDIKNYLIFLDEN